MITKRNIGTVAALGGVTAVVALLTGLPSARADEVSDLRASNQALQDRVDQLAQAIPGPGGFYTQGAPPAPSAGAGLVGGSFPRSFLIPGTDTSIRVGGEIRVNATFWFNGRTPNQAPPSTNVLNNGGLNAVPVQIHNAIVGGVVVPSSNPTRSRDSSVFTLSPQQTKFNFETRTPTAFGEARTFIELDFAGGSSFSPGGVNQLTSTDSLTPRLRYAYGTLGGFLAGQANSNFSDPDADPPQLEFGGTVGSPGVTRVPQVRYTTPLAPYGLLGALSFSAEAPETEVWTAGQGIVATDTGDVSLAANPALACTTTVTGATATTNCPVGGTVPAFNPTKSPAPDLTAAWYIPQPWGHLDMSLVFRPALQLKDGRFVDQTVMGYGGHIGGDVKPGWFGWAKDDFTFHFEAGDGIGRFIGGNQTMVSIVSNYPALSPTTAAAGGPVTLKTVTAFGANASYTHYWADNIRSYAAVGIQHMDLPNNLRTIPVSATGAVGPTSTDANPVCPGGINAARLAATGGCNLNRELVSASFGTIWSPVSFVDFGAEYAYGHRLTLSGLKGDTSAAIGRFTVRF
jgi:Porin subfamily